MQNTIYLFLISIFLINCQQTSEINNQINDSIKRKIHFTLIIFLSMVIGLVVITIFLMFIYQPSISNSQNIIIPTTETNDGEELEDLNIDPRPLNENK
jgi:hypothetical protein